MDWSRKNRIIGIVLLSVMFSLAPHILYGRKISVDSLVKLIPSKTGKEKMDLLEKVAYFYRHRNPEKSLNFGYQALRYAQLVDNRNYFFTAYSIISLAHRYNSNLDSALYYGEKDMEIARMTQDTSQNYLANNRLGLIYKKKGNYLTAISYFSKAISYATTKRMEADLYNNIGISYKYLGNYLEALEYYSKTLHIRKQTHDSLGYAYILNNIANLYGNMEQYRKALNTMRQSVHIKEKLKLSPFDLSLGYGNLAEYYLLLRDSTLYDSIFYFIRKAEEQALIANNEELRNTAISKLAKYYQIKGEYEESTKLYDSILTFFKSKEMTTKAAHILLEIASNKMSQGQFLSARKTLESAHKIIRKHDILPQLMPYYQLSSDLHMIRHAYKEAYMDLQSLNDLRSKMFTSEIQKKITDIEVKKQLESKEKDNRILSQQNMLQKAKLAQKNTIIYFSVFLLALVVIFLFFIFKSLRALKEKHQILLQTKEELEVSRQSLLNANNVKNKLFSIVSHDILNGFHPLYGMLEYLRNNVKEMDKEEIYNVVNNVFRGATRNLHLMKNILLWGKSQMNNFELNPEELDIHEIIAKNLRNMQIVAENKGIYFLNKVPPQTKVIADKEAVLSILRNICFNAVKFSPEGEKIIISAADEGNKVKICVKDHGVGMGPEKIEQILKGLEMKSQDGTQQEKGSGLGLIVTKEFIEKSGGELSIESTINVGTKMCFTLPKPEKRYHS